MSLQPKIKNDNFTCEHWFDSPDAKKRNSRSKHDDNKMMFFMILTFKFE